jgi:hypothetical protein
MKILNLFFLLFINVFAVSAQVNVGSASYTTSFPGADEAGRNSYPSGSPQLSGNALNKPVPTNDWWSKLVKENHADNLFNYPMTHQSGFDRNLHPMGSYWRQCGHRSWIGWVKHQPRYGV